MNIEKTILQYFHRKHRLEKLMDLNAPTIIITKEQDLITKTLQSFKSLNFDIDKYMNESGQYEYLCFTIEQQHIENSNNICGQCSHYHLINNTFHCSLNNDFLICKQFNTTNLDIHQRIASFIKQCESCTNSQSSTDNIIKCVLNLNQLTTCCPRKTQKDTQ